MQRPPSSPRGLRLIAALAACALAAAGCSQSAGDAQAASAPAGDVAELVGEVAAIRGDERRVLSVGDAVSADDVIVTGDGSRVTILLRHNHARFSVGPIRAKKVAESAAWKATEAAAEEPVAAPAAPAAPEAVLPDAATALSDTAPPPDAGTAVPTAESPAPPRASGRSTIKPKVVRKALDKRKKELGLCYRKLAPGDSGTLAVVLSVDGNGRVTDAAVSGPPGLAPIQDCVERALGKVRFTGENAPSAPTVVETSLAVKAKRRAK
jgi:type IV secretory pathway VirJ component